MFKYSKTAGYLSIGAIALAVLPVIVAIIVIPDLPDSVPMNFAGDRWGSKFELLIPPVLALAFGLGIYLQTARKAADHARDSMTMAITTAERFMRNAVVTTAAIDIAFAWLLYGVMTGLAA